MLLLVLMHGMGALALMLEPLHLLLVLLLAQAEAPQQEVWRVANHLASIHMTRDM